MDELKFTAKQVEEFNRIDPAHQGLEELIFAWKEYALASDKDLHASGRELKRQLLALVHDG